MSDDSVLNSALRLAGHGYKVLPVDRQEKRPLIKGWTITTATGDPEQIEKWWSGRFSDANVGVSTGMSDVLVVEFDPRHDGDHTIGRWLREYDTDFVKTVSAVSGTGGEHLYFNAGGTRFRTTTGEIGPGVDTRAVGGMVVAPYSLHANGSPYEWIRGYSPDDRPMLPVPDFLKTLIPLARVPQAERRQWIGSRVIGKPLDIERLRSLCAEALTTKELDAPDTDDDFALAVQRFLGVPDDVGLGQAFLCVLPGHDERRPSASLGRDSRGRWVYRDHHQRGGCPQFMTLAEAYASMRCGHVQDMAGPTLATWKIAMLAEMGLVSPVDVPMRSLPDGAGDDLRRVHDGIRRLLSLKWLYDYGEATACAWSFMADWTGVNERRIAAAMKELLRSKIIRQVGTHTTPRGVEMALFLPVGKARAHRRKCG